MLPTLGEERQQTYSPFLPHQPPLGQGAAGQSGGARRGARAPSPMSRKTASLETVPVTGGHCKLQWKPDFGMRWAALGVDYEMYGKDHLAQTPLYDAICSIAGGTPPEHFMLRAVPGRQGPENLQVQRQRHHHRRMAGLWTAESLALFMFQKPRAAKRLYFDVIPKAVDDYIALLDAYHASRNEREQRLENPVWHHSWRQGAGGALSGQLRAAAQSGAAPPTRTTATCCGASSAPMRPDASPEANPGLERLVGYALRYYEDFVKPAKRLSRAGRQGTRGAGRPGGAAGKAGRRTRRRGGAECGL